MTRRSRLNSAVGKVDAVTAYVPQSWKAPKVLTSSLVKNMVTNVLGRTPMTSPPTITQAATATQAGAGYTTTQALATSNYGTTPADSPGSSAFRLGGGPIFASANGVAYASPRFPVALNGTYPYANRMSVEFDTEADKFELQSGPPGGGTFLSHRIYVNEQPITIPRLLTGVTTVSGNTQITVASTAGLLVGEVICGPNVNASGAYIASIDSATTLTMSVIATASGSGLTLFTPGVIYGANKFLAVNFGSRSTSPRRIFWEIINLNTSSYSGAYYFSSIARPSGSTLTFPRIKTSRAVVISDSYGAGVDGQSYFSYGSNGLQWSLIALRSLGISDVYTHTSISSTGVVQATATFGGYSARLSDVYKLAPDLVIYQGSLNDPSNGKTALVQAQATTDLKAIIANLPNAQVIVTGILYPANPQTNYAATDTALAAAVAAVGSPNVQFVSLLQQAIPPFFGTGRVGATNASGPSDYLLGTDNAHPSPTPSPNNSGNASDLGGHAAIGLQLAQQMAPLLGLAV